jgi:hypothetical protein
MRRCCQRRDGVDCISNRVRGRLTVCDRDRTLRGSPDESNPAGREREIWSKPLEVGFVSVESAIRYSR